MFFQILLVTLISGKGINAETATSYVSVSKGKEGGYSYEVIHDYPTKGALSSIHSFSDVDDYNDRPPDVSYDYEVRHTPGSSGESPSSKPSPPVSSSPPAQGSIEYDGNRSSQINDVKNFGVVKHSATAPGGSHSATRPGSQSYSSAFVNVKNRPYKGSQRKPKISNIPHSTAAPSYQKVKGSSAGNDYGNSVGGKGYKAQSGYGIKEHVGGAFSPSSDYGYKGATVNDHSYEEPTKIIDYDYKSPAPLVSDYKGITPNNDQGYKGPSSTSTHGFTGVTVSSNYGYSGPTPSNVHGFGPSPSSNSNYHGPTLGSNHENKGAPLHGPTDTPFGPTVGPTTSQTVFDDSGFRASWTTNTNGLQNHGPTSPTKNYGLNTQPIYKDINHSVDASASGPGATFSRPVMPSPVDHGPSIYHHHHNTGQAVDESFFDFPTEVKTPKTKGHKHLTESNHGLKTTFGHACSTNDVTPIPSPSKYPDFDFSKFPELNGFPKPEQTTSDDEFYSKLFSKPYPSGGKKGKWKPVIITSSKNKGKLYTFRISKDFKPGKLMGGFKPSYGPPSHHKTTGHLKYTAESQYSYGDNSGQVDPFAHFKDAPYFDYDSFASPLGSDYGDSQGDDVDGLKTFDEFSDYGSSEKKSLKDYHNSLTGYSSKASNYRQSKGSKLSASPIVVPPLRTTTTVHSSTTITSPVPVEITSFVDVPSPLAVHAIHRVTGRNAEHPGKFGSTGKSATDQATSYANAQKRSSGRPSKRKTTQNKT